jgi:outer membrane protein
LLSFTANAQKIALIDMEYILENIPAYQKATNELEQLSLQYQKAIEAKAKEAEFLYEAYQKSANTMSASLRSQKEEAIVAKEKEAMELRQKYFGNEGEMRKKEEALIVPIQDQIYEAVKQISMQKGYDIVIDRASENSMIYASPKIDISNEILRKLGYSK